MSSFDSLKQLHRGVFPSPPEQKEGGKTILGMVIVAPLVFIIKRVILWPLAFICFLGDLCGNIWRCNKNEPSSVSNADALESCLQAPHSAPSQAKPEQDESEWSGIGIIEKLGDIVVIAGAIFISPALVYVVIAAMVLVVLSPFYWLTGRDEQLVRLCSSLDFPRTIFPVPWEVAFGIGALLILCRPLRQLAFYLVSMFIGLITGGTLPFPFNKAVHCFWVIIYALLAISTLLLIVPATLQASIEWIETTLIPFLRVIAKLVAEPRAWITVIFLYVAYLLFSGSKKT